METPEVHSTGHPEKLSTLCEGTARSAQFSSTDTSGQNCCRDSVGMARFQKRQALISLAVFACLLATFCIFMTHEYSRFMAIEDETLEKQFDGYTQVIVHLFSDVVNGLDGIRHCAETDLFESRHLKTSMPPVFQFVKAKPAGGYYTLDDIEGFFCKGTVANLTGMGRLDGRSEDFHRRIAMALNLVDNFRCLQKSIPAVSWIYWISTEKAMLLFPWVPSSITRFDSGIYSRDLWKMGLPENNVRRDTYWTKVYPIHDGKGLMVTCAVPVYDQSCFTGILGADLSVEYLNAVVAGFGRNDDGIMLICDRAGNLLACPQQDASDDSKVRHIKQVLPEEISSYIESRGDIPQSTMITAGPWNLIYAELAGTPFKVFGIVPRHSRTMVLFSEIGYKIIGMVGIMISLVVISLILTHKRFIQPAEKFINYILIKSRRKDSDLDQRVPAVWKPWFRTISRVFDENQKLTLALQEKNRELQHELVQTRRLQSQLIHSERLAATGQLAASIAHEINSPLQAVTSLLNVIKMEHSDDKDLLQHLKMLQGAYTHIRETVNNLLDLNRPSMTKRHPVDVNTVIRNIMVLVRAHLRKQKIDVILDLSPQTSVVFVSPQQLGQVLINLINNAVEAMTEAFPADGNSGLRPHDMQITFHTRSEGRQVVIEVADTGPGIGEEDLGRIFDPFYTKNKINGVGLGLSLCRTIIDDHQGTMTAKNVPEGGVVFTITLPAGSPSQIQTQ